MKLDLKFLWNLIWNIYLYDINKDVEYLYFFEPNNIYIYISSKLNKY
jgi:hypothetical protein